MTEKEKFKELIYKNFDLDRELSIIQNGLGRSRHKKTEYYEYQFSVIIPVYNGELYVEKSINSAFEQKGVTIQVIVINDGSTDESANICRKYMGRDDYIFLEQENSGPSVSRNRGLEQATGRFIAFLDADDALAENALARAYEIMVKEELEVLCFDVEKYRSDGSITGRYRPTNIKSGEIISGVDYITKFGYNISCTAWNYYFRKSFLDALGIRFVPHLLHEDCEFTAHYFPYVRRFSYISKSFYRQILSPNSIMRSGNIKKSCDLIEISRIIYQDAEVMRHFLPHSVVDHIYQYAASEAWACVRSCVQMGFDLDEFLKDVACLNKVLLLLKPGRKYRIMYFLIRHRQYRAVKFLIRKFAVTRDYRAED